MLSGQFSRQGIDADCPDGFHKVCEGSAAVLFPPAMIREGGGSRKGKDKDPQREGERTPTTKKKKKSEAEAKEADGDDDDEDDSQAVFYNPAQVVNRDLSVCVVQMFSRLRKTESRRKGGVGESGITILEALSATGLRAIRYFTEIEGVRYIIANDLDSDAVDCIRRNCAFNGVPVFAPGVYENHPSAAESDDVGRDGSGGRCAVGKAGIIPNLDDAVDLMHRLGMNQRVHHYGQRSGEAKTPPQVAGSRFVLLSDPPANQKEERGPTDLTGASVRGVLQQELMDVVDLDPYGSASPFLEAAFGCIKEGGLMLVTSTDSAILCGNHIDTCHGKYSAIPYKASHCHEMAVRILLGCIERVANKHSKYIVPLLSLHIDFYVRCFFRVYTQPAEVKLSPCKLGYQLQCTHCPAFWVRPMATAQPRVTKAERKAARRERSAANLKRGRNEEEERGESKEERKAEEEAEAEAMEGGVPSKPERFPVPPPRQETPKLQCLNLHQLPALHYNNTTAGDATEAYMDGSRGHGSCPVCGVGAISLSGPIYAAATQNAEFLAELSALIAERDAAKRLTATARISGLVQVAKEELEDCPLFYNVPDIASYVKVPPPPTPQLVAALGRLGYRCSQVHCCASGMKTDCPPETLFSLMLSWKMLFSRAAAAAAEAEGKGKGKETEETEETRKLPSQKLLVRAFTPAEKVDFRYDPKMDYRAKRTGAPKFVQNAPGWGPRRRHQGARDPATEDGNAETKGGS